MNLHSVMKAWTWLEQKRIALSALGDLALRRGKELQVRKPSVR